VFGAQLGDAPGYLVGIADGSGSIELLDGQESFAQKDVAHGGAVPSSVLERGTLFAFENVGDGLDSLAFLMELPNVLQRLQLLGNLDHDAAPVLVELLRVDLAVRESSARNPLRLQMIHRDLGPFTGRVDLSLRHHRSHHQEHPSRRSPWVHARAVEREQLVFGSLPKVLVEQIRPVPDVARDAIHADRHQ
jgi:hypothetical protein